MCSGYCSHTYVTVSHGYIPLQCSNLVSWFQSRLCLASHTEEVPTTVSVKILFEQLYVQSGSSAETIQEQLFGCFKVTRHPTETLVQDPTLLGDFGLQTQICM